MALRIVGWVVSVSLLGWLAGGACVVHRGPPESGYGQPTGYDQYGNPIYAQPGSPGPGPPPPHGRPHGPPAPGGAPGPAAGLAPPCQSDFVCGTYRCNVQLGRCAFPCQSSNDCAVGLTCMSGVCLPGLGPSP